MKFNGKENKVETSEILAESKSLGSGAAETCGKASSSKVLLGHRRQIIYTCYLRVSDSFSYSAHKLQQLKTVPGSCTCAARLVRWTWWTFVNRRTTR